jgi:hypothetical protein
VPAALAGISEVRTADAPAAPMAILAVAFEAVLRKSRRLTGLSNIDVLGMVILLVGNREIG